MSRRLGFVWTVIDLVVADSVLILGWSARIIRFVTIGLGERVDLSHELLE